MHLCRFTVARDILGVLVASIVEDDKHLSGLGVARPEGREEFDDRIAVDVIRSLNEQELLSLNAIDPDYVVAVAPRIRQNDVGVPAFTPTVGRLGIMDKIGSVTKVNRVQLLSFTIIREAPQARP